MTDKLIYAFSSSLSEGDASMRDILGGKGANLAEMSRVGLPVPAGFTISCAACALYYKEGGILSAEMRGAIKAALLDLEKVTKKSFGSLSKPLLVSVRSGSKFSMPGMLDTVLNIGLNDDIVRATNSRFILDSYRRLIQMYGNVVLKIDSYHFEEALYEYKQLHSLVNDSDLQNNHLHDVIAIFQKVVSSNSDSGVPQDVESQIFGAIEAVFKSWHNDRARTYRKINDISEDIGTAVNIQSMVFGNLNDYSASGVVFTRDPSSGEKKIFGEYIKNAQGEDVVSGARTPSPIEEMKVDFPLAYRELVKFCDALEVHYKDVQDIEFTIEDNKLYILQTRNAKRSAAAAVKVAVDFVKEGWISEHEALLRVDPKCLEGLLHPRIDDLNSHTVLSAGLPASPGAVSGKVIFCSEEAVRCSHSGEKVILIKNETSPEDIAGMYASVAIVTLKGGMTSHAAVVARGMGKPCICALSRATLEVGAGILSIHPNIVVKKGDFVTVDGSTGSLILGDAKTSSANFSEEFHLLMDWADKYRKIGVRVNAETKEDINVALKFKADGIGLCRTEHMFFSDDRINIVRDMIMAEDVDSRKVALDKLLPIQRNDFIQIFQNTSGMAVTIRLLDPPLHEFLPLDDLSMRAFVEYSGLPESFVRRRVKALSEENPMLGHRGCRLAISYPEIYEMQLHAIFSAAVHVGGVSPEIMVPFVMNAKEVSLLKTLVEDVAQGYAVRYSFGNMLELPSAAILSDEIALHSDFFSFGTNDLTQTTLGISRDDCAIFISSYKEKGVLKEDPFVTLQEENVGYLIKESVRKGLSSNNKLKIGICGEHGGDPKSVKFFASIPVDYVSCSPYRVPIAKLSAAQSMLASEIEAKREVHNVISSV